MPRELMVKVLAPIKVNSFVIEFLMESIAVSIPTNAVIPTAIISTVSMVRSRLLRIDCKAILKFSKKSVPNLITYLFDERLIGRISSEIITLETIEFKGQAILFFEYLQPLFNDQL